MAPLLPPPAAANGWVAKFLRARLAFRNWPRVMADHLRLSRADYICQLRDGPSLEVRGGTDDRHVLFEIFAQRVYEAPLAPGDIVVDIGANIGGFTVLAAHRGARVYGFEPWPPNFAALDRNVRRNGLDAVVQQVAISNEPGERDLFRPADAAHLGRFSLHPGRGDATLSVRCISLDEVVRTHALDRIDLLKIDCQGSEYEILFALDPSTLAIIRRIIVECEEFPDRPEWTTDAMARFLERSGFSTARRGHVVHAARLSPSTRHPLPE